MVWRAKDEVHMLSYDATNNALQALALVKTLTRVRIDNDLGFDVQPGVGRYLPDVSDPRYRVSLEGLFPNDPTFIKKLMDMTALAVAEPYNDGTYTNAFDWVSNAALTTTTTHGPVVLALGTLPNTIEITVNDGGVQFSSEHPVIDVVNGKFVVESDGTAVTARKFVADAVAQNLLMPTEINVAEGQTQPVLDTIYDPLLARKSVATISLVDNLGNTVSLFPREIRMTLDYNAEIAYTRNGLGIGRARTAPQLTIEVTALSTEDVLKILPMNVARVGQVIYADNPLVVEITNVARVEITEMVIQTDTFEVSDDYPEPTITLLPLRYKLYDGSGNLLANVA